MGKFLGGTLGGMGIFSIFAAFKLHTDMYMKQIALTLFALLATGVAWAQDDVYFVPTKKALEAERREVPGRSSYESLGTPSGRTFEHDDWADGRKGIGRDIDEYNRRGASKWNSDSIRSMSSRGYYDEDYTATARIVRFRSPRACVVASPFYYDYADLGFYDPWFDDWTWGGWYSPYPSLSFSWGRGLWGTSWRFGGWYSPWYYSGWASPWYSYWGSPWFDDWALRGRYSPYYYSGWASYSRPRGAWYGTPIGTNVGGVRGSGFYSGGTRGSDFGGSAYTGTRSSYSPAWTRGTSRSSYTPSYQNRGNYVSGDRTGSRSSYTPTNTRGYSDNNYSAPSRSTYESPSRSGSSYSAPSRSGGFYNGGSRGSFSGGGGGYSSGGSRGGYTGGRR